MPVSTELNFQIALFLDFDKKLIFIGLRQYFHDLFHAML